MDEEAIKQIVFLLAIFIGQILTVYIPYRNKQKDDGRPFDLSYAYTAVLGYIGMATLAINSEFIMSMPLEAASVMTLIFTSGVLERTFIAPITPKTK